MYGNNIQDDLQHYYYYLEDNREEKLIKIR